MTVRVRVSAMVVGGGQADFKGMLLYLTLPPLSEADATPENMAHVASQKTKDRLTAIADMAIGKAKAFDEALDEACTEGGMTREEFKKAVRDIVFSRWRDDTPTDEVRCFYCLGYILLDEGAETSVVKTWWTLAVEAGYDWPKRRLRCLIDLGRFEVVVSR